MTVFMCAHAMGVPIEGPAGCWAPCSVSLSSSFRTGPATERRARLASSSDPPVSTLHKPGAKEGTATPSFTPFTWVLPSNSVPHVCTASVLTH